MRECMYPLWCFNSNTVRLRDGACACCGACACWFQFQYGAIKSKATHLLDGWSQRFQFQYGAIKSIYFHTEKFKNNKFQFQYGAIKRAVIPVAI